MDNNVSNDLLRDREVAFRELLRATVLFPAPGHESDLISGFVTRYFRALITTAVLVQRPNAQSALKQLENAQFEIDRRDLTISDPNREEEYYFLGDDVSSALQSTFLYWSFIFKNEDNQFLKAASEYTLQAFSHASKSESPSGITKYLSNFTQLESLKSKEHPAKSIWELPLFDIMGLKFEGETANVIHSKIEKLLKDETTNFWIEWFQSIIDGKPLSWSLQHDISALPDRVWKGPPKVLGMKIDEIRARFELEQEIAKLKEENARLAAKSRFEIGANGGPELDDEAGRVVQEIIWAPIDALDAETKKDEPDKSVIWGAIERLQAGLKWLGSAAGAAAVGNGVNAIWENPSVLIEWIMPVLEVAQRWLAALM